MAGLNEKLENTFDYIAQEQLEGLILPPEAVLVNTTLWLGLLLISSLLLLSFWRWNKHRHSAIFLAQKKLAALEECVTEPQDETEVALQLNSLLCQGLKIKRLDQYQPEDSEAWRAFHTQLNSLCYSPASQKPVSKNLQLQDKLLKGNKRGMCALSPQLSQLLTEAKNWLKNSRFNKT